PFRPIGRLEFWLRKLQAVTLAACGHFAGPWLPALPSHWSGEANLRMRETRCRRIAVLKMLLCGRLVARWPLVGYGRHALPPATRADWAMVLRATASVASPASHGG